MPSNAYPGLEAFRDEPVDRGLFFGRELEATALSHQVCAERLTLLYGKSGMGKSSLINARLLVSLRDRGYLPFKARPTLETSAAVVDAVRQAIEASATVLGAQLQIDPAAASLWRLFLTLRITYQGRHLRPVLIFDQFEELFTRVRQERPQAYESITVQLADLVRGRMPELERAQDLKKIQNLPEGDEERNRLQELVFGTCVPDIKVLLSLREDFLPEIEALGDRLPGILKNTVRLLPLNREAARAAIEGPAAAAEVLGKDGIFQFDPGVVDQILDFLSVRILGGKRCQGDEIEPIQLQILCSEINQRRQKGGATRVAMADIGGVVGMRKILRNHYARAIRSFPALKLGWSQRKFLLFRGNGLLFHSPRQAVRNLCERGLITKTGRRNSIMLDLVSTSYGVPQDDVRRLIELRLVRKEFRLGSDFFELTHDSLLEPLISKRRASDWLRGAVWTLVPVLAIGSMFGAQAYSDYERLQVFAADAKKSREEADKRQGELRALRDALNRPDQEPQERQKTIRQILEKSGTDLTSADLRGLDFSGKVLSRIDFSHAKLTGARFDGSVVQGGKFDGAQLQSSTFLKAQLFRSSAVEIDASHAIYRGANLMGLDFRRAKLVAADFRDVDLATARFDGALITDASFEGTQWWLASGWSASQLKHLLNRFPPTAFAKSEKYADAIASFDRRASVAPNSVDQAGILNDRAWYLACSMLKLDEALRDARAAWKLAKIRQPVDNEELAVILDTIGYIHLGLGHDVEALATLMEAVAFNKSTETMYPSIRYHLSIALRRNQRQAEAVVEETAALSSRYVPSYERLLEQVSQKGSGSEAKPS